MHSSAPAASLASGATQHSPALQTRSNSETKPAAQQSAPGATVGNSHQPSDHATPQHDTGSEEYSSDDSELPGEALHFFLQISSNNFTLPLRDLEPMHCLEADRTDTQSIFRPDLVALFHSVVWSGCLGFFLTLWDPEDLTPEQHSWLQAMLRAAHLQGAHVGFFFPHPCPAQLESSYIQLCQELATHCYWSTALADDAKPRIFCCTDPQLGDVASLSSSDIVALAKLSASGSPHSVAPLRNFHSFMPQCFAAKRPAVCDGAGLFSNADNMSASSTQAHAPMKEAAKDILAYLRQHNLVHSIAQHLRERKETEPLSEHHGAVIAEIIRRKVDPECSTEHCLAISPGQPFRLNLLHSIALAIQDKDAQLPTILEQGVPTGAFDPLPSSKQWPQAPHSIDASSDLQGPHLEHCRGNWTAAEQSPELLAQLIEQEVEKGFVKRFEGTEEDAALHWPKGTAIGKLNVVVAEGRDPRLVLDSTVCGLNPAVHIPERVALPTASDVQRTFLAEDCYAQQTALSIDFKAAHKCNKVHPSEHGTLLFRQGNALYYYTVCHFGARFSAYWWQRTGGLILRCLHALLGRYPHKAWLYVDDLLCMLRTAQSEQCAALIVALLAALRAPISWKKAQFSTSVTWCGWTFCTATETIELVPSKLRKLREQLQALQQKSKIPRKELEAVLGLLNWATSISKHLRPFMAPLYKDLHSGQGTLHSIAPSAWQAFYDCLDASGQLSRTPPGSWLPRSGRILEVGAPKVSCKADVPKVPPSHKHSWVRIFDPHRGEIHLRQESKFVLEWLRHCFAHEQPRSLRAAPLLHCLSAADAFADKHRMGIGGWLTTSKRYFWYSEIFTAEQVRQQWPQLSGSLQPYIGCFEALAQLALAQCVWQALRSKHVRFVLPSASDNTSAESGLNKLFSTAEPLGTFLRLAATWAHLHRVQFQVEHLAGEKNTWADKLSRGSIEFMQRRSADRVRVTLSQLASASHSVSLHGSATQWPDTLVQAQHEMLK